MGCHSRSNRYTILENHPAYHPRQKQGGAGAQTQKEGEENTHDESYKLYDPNRKVELVVYSMERFAKDCVNVFCELAGCDKTNVGAAPTPFLDESKDPLVVIQEPRHGQTAPQEAPHGGGGGLRKGGTTEKGGANVVNPGQLSHIATRCLMKIMYIARLALQDLLRAVGALTTTTTRWDEMCDRKPYRIIKYMNGSVPWRQIGFIGGSPDELEPGLFPMPILLGTGPT